jgi:hypothetical protein
MFLSLFAQDAVSDRSPWGDFWFKPVPYKGGMDVTPDIAMQLTAVYACVRILSEGVDRCRSNCAIRKTAAAAGRTTKSIGSIACSRAGRTISRTRSNSAK